jgi:PKD repeat protein
MLGRWADGMHYEPMEFGYDLTDLSSKFDTHKPLKYFFIIDTKSAAAGTGTIHKCSIIDYELDRQGIEVPFNIPASGVTIQNKGTRTIISMVVTGEPFNAPRNLTLADHTMTWQQPQTSSYTVSKYNIYQNNTLYASTEAGTTSFVIPDDSTAIYSVSAVYSINGNDLESGKSNAVRLPERVTKSADVLLMSNAGFTIPDIFNDKYSNVTIEYWLKPTSLTDWNQQIGPNWGQFLMHVTANKEFVAGWNTGYDRFFTPTNSISAGQWYHFAIVVSGNKMTAYINGVQKGTVTSEHFTGLGGFGDLTVGSHSSNNYGMYGRMDEMRIWKEARTPEQIRAYMNTEIANPTAESNLMAYYKMDMVKENGVNKLRDCARGHNATLVGGPIGQIDSTLLKGNTTLKAAFTMPSGAIYQGQSVTFTNASSANVASWAWNIPAAGIKNLNVSSPEVTFPQSGKFDVSLRVSDNKGNTADTTATVMVEKLGAPVAAFHLATDTTIYAGQHISFVNTSTGVGCTYEWTIQSADPERCVTTNAAATFLTAGTHTVTLKVTNAAGTSSVSHDVTVEKAAPEVAFNVRPDVVIKGETAYLEDKTKYEPTSWNWILDSDNFAMSMKGQNSSFVPTTPGVYDVSLSTSNEIGNNTLTRKRALTVCNADAMTGLKFGGTGETVTFAGLFASESKAFTIDWWMYPTQLKTDCDAMGDSESTFLIKTDETGAMHFCINGKSAVTDAGFVTPMQWHHYAIAFRNGVPMFYKDGVQWNKSSNIDYAARICPALANGFKIGSSTAPMNAVIDELHIWNKYLTLPTIQAYSNAPITNIDSVTTADNLVLYCNFNQSSGNVKDASKNSYVGVRSGFGPEGDAWCSSKGVFCLNFDNSGKNVTVNYLTNYVMPFRHSSTYVTGTSRFYGLETGTTTSTWVLDNQVKVGSVTTGLYVDQQKDYAMTVATSWDGFSNNLTDHKAYQTITLPAGAYELTTEPYTEFSADGSYLAVAAGAGLPDTKNLATDAIGFSMLNTKSLKFILPEEKQVSLGVIINMSGQNCCTFKQFNLLTKPFAVITADGHTGIESTQNSSAVTFHAYSRDGQLVMSTALPQRVTVYNLQGQRIYDKMVSGSISLSIA